MAKIVAKFEKVSFEQFRKDFIDTFTADNMLKYGILPYRIDELVIRKVWEDIELPKRETFGSAGHDFKSPITFTLKPGETLKIPTGIRVHINEDWVMKCYPRSGLGFKYRLQLNNTVGIIDRDYFYSDNEGHIFAKITNDSNEGKEFTIEAGTGFMQGVFVEYGITEDDNPTKKRNGGFGSTTGKN